MIGKRDKNLVFTPDHICDFICKVLDVGKHSRILDPCCGDGTFLIRAMNNAINDCETNDERDDIIKSHIYGIEFDNNVFDLATKNMTNHGCEVSNIVHDSMFNCSDWIESANINIVFINPPYNATKQNCNPEYIKSWKVSKKEDPSKGFHFVEWVCDHVSSNCKVAALLPMQTAIGTSDEIKKYKKRMLEKYTLDAVFSLPSELFFPDASAVICCMVFDLGKPHRSDKETFFGYFKEDGFEKRKGVGRVDINESWNTIQEEWLDLYNHRSTVAGKSVNRHVKASDEWCAEAYMKADYSCLSKNLFVRTVRDYLSYLVKDTMNTLYIPNGNTSKAPTDWLVDFIKFTSKNSDEVFLCTSDWKEVEIKKYFSVKAGKYYYSYEYDVGNTPYLSASNENNGVKQKINISPDFDGNCIITGKVGCTTFYEPFPFCATSDVNVLIPKFKLSVEIGLFLATIINYNENFRWNYGRQCRVGNTQRIKILLPVKNGEPDWQFMENYIKSLPYGDRI